MKVNFNLDLYDPKTIDIAKAIKSAQITRAAEIEAEELAKRRNELKKKYADVLNFNMNDEIDNIMAHLFHILVPQSGLADTVAGELVRAIERVRYRDLNDGDRFYEGYGIETCACPVEYIVSIIPELQDKFIQMAEENGNDDYYTDHLNKIAKEIASYIVEHPELIAAENTVDSNEFKEGWIEDYVPRYDYDFELPENITKYLDNEDIDAWKVKEELESMMDWNSCFEGAEVDTPWSSYSTSVNISNLKAEGLQEIKSWRLYEESSWSSFESELKGEYGDPDEEDEDEEEE